MARARRPKKVFYCECGRQAFAQASRGLIVFVDYVDAKFLQERAWNAWPNGKNFYAVSGVHPNRLKLHQVIAGRGMDHIDGNGMNNMRGNLRAVNHRTNVRNRRRSGNHTSQYRGVSWDVPRQKWRARIRLPNGSVSFLGRFAEEADAALAYDSAVLKLDPFFPRLNFQQMEG